MNNIYEKAVKRAKKWQKKIEVGRLAKERRFHSMMQAMLKDSKNKTFLIKLLDQSFRSNDSKRVAKQLNHIFYKYPQYNFFPWLKAIGLRLFRYIGLYFPWIAIPVFTHTLREELKDVVLKSEEPFLVDHMESRKKELTTVNVNFIGESVLGEKEAQKRIKGYIKAIESEDIHYISIKVSTIYSQITPIAFEQALKELVSRLTTLYTACLEQTPHTFINLDMENYSDLDLSVAAFKETLSLPHLEELKAGIVLQSYLPDSFEILKDLTAWAKERVLEGGSPIKVRLVKGANAEMEAFESTSHGWENVLLDTKEQTDANFKKMMLYMLDAQNAPYVEVGIASHNLFDQALAYEVALANETRAYYTAEMLEGMSEAAYKTLKDEDIECILYAPVSSKEDFNSAIAYLVRRFDENTAEDNFMRHSFGLQADSKDWNMLEKGFLDAAKLIDTLTTQPKRQQDRNQPPVQPSLMKEKFISEADTDFSLHQNRVWAQKIITKWSSIDKAGGYHARPIIAGKAISEGEKVTVFDKSQFHEKIEVGSYVKSGKNDLEVALACAVEDSAGWRSLSYEKRQEVLHQTAQLVRERRDDLIGLAAAECGKTISESDVEVSEAVDFLEFYPFSVAKLREIEGLDMSPKGVSLVITPWNFPIAIAVGGIAAALATGNTVLFKPASASTLVGHMICQCFWDAGVSQESLQFIPSSPALISDTLLASDAIDFVIFTGGEESAYKILQAQPTLSLSAETGGKNATIVTAMADRDQAIKNVLHSAFSNSGQKCSASSLLILEAELFDDEGFIQTLKDAVASLYVGSAWKSSNRLGPLVNKPGGYLKEALENLSENEQWLIAPKFVDDNPYLLKPSVRIGTVEGDFCHDHELFGPVLSIMRANDFYHAVDIANSTGYGLTSGLESLDEREQAYFTQNMEAGNLYINRSTTGAIVMRQPFGGLKKSSFGRGLKAGGLSYVTQFMNYKGESKDYSEDMNYWYENYFSKELDYFKLLGEHNIQKFLPVKNLLLMVGVDDEMAHVEAYIKASQLSKVELTLGFFDEGKTIKGLKDRCNTKIKHYHKEDFLQEAGTYSRIRVFNVDVIDKDTLSLCAEKKIYLNSGPFVPSGRIEMLYFFHEQTVSNAYHRYGNINSEDI